MELREKATQNVPAVDVPLEDAFAGCVVKH
jgi:hypothetical protein